MADGYTQSPNLEAFDLVGGGSSSSLQQHEVEAQTNIRDNGSGRERTERRAIKEKVAFITKSEDVEILDDGYNWRKYGMKEMRNNPNPRSYYRCSIKGCPMMKTAQRDDEDPTYVITIYRGIHNHHGPVQY